MADKGDITFTLIMNLMAFMIQRGMVNKDDFLGFVDALKKGEKDPDGRAVYEFLREGLTNVPEPAKPH